MSQTHPNAMHGGQILANALVRQGVEIAFGVPGESFLPLLDGLVDPIRALLSALTETMASQGRR